MVYRPGLVRCMQGVAPGLVAGVRVPLGRFWARQRVRAVHDTVVGLDPDRRVVHLATQDPLPYDVVFIATGSCPAWDAIPGLDRAVAGICEGYLARHTANLNARQVSGHVVFAAGPCIGAPNWEPPLAVGCECPLLEAALLWDGWLRKTGRRNSARITVVTPARTIFETLGPKGRSALERALRGREIALVTRARYRRVGSGVIELQDRVIACDRMIWVPPLAGPRWTQVSGIDDGRGWVPTDAYLNHPAWPNIYAVGDVVSHPWPKSGHAAMVEARVAVHHWAWRDHTLPKEPAAYRPEVLAVLQDSDRTAFGLRSDTFYGGTRDFVRHGRLPHCAKRLFEWAYVRSSGDLPLMP
jgi:sulfide:quinone oxidoreductase